MKLLWQEYFHCIVLSVSLLRGGGLTFLWIAWNILSFVSHLFLKGHEIFYLVSATDQLSQNLAQVETINQMQNLGASILNSSSTSVFVVVVIVVIVIVFFVIVFVVVQAQAKDEVGQSIKCKMSGIHLKLLLKICLPWMQKHKIKARGIVAKNIS